MQHTSSTSSLELSSPSMFTSWVSGSTALPFPLASEVGLVAPTFSCRVADPFWSAILIVFWGYEGFCGVVFVVWFEGSGLRLLCFGEARFSAFTRAEAEASYISE